VRKITVNEVCEAMSEDVEVKVGDQVYVASTGSKKLTAMVLELENGDGELLVSERRDTGGNVVEAGSARVGVRSAWVVGSVRCTHHEVRRAKELARAKFPGAKPDAHTNPHSGISKERAAYVSDFIRRDDNVAHVAASLDNSKKGVKYQLKMRRWSLWNKLVFEMEAKGHKPCGWGYFWALTGTAQYELMKYDNCCCGTCRELGFENYDELRSIVEGTGSVLKLLSGSAESCASRRSRSGSTNWRSSP